MSTLFYKEYNKVFEYFVTLFVHLIVMCDSSSFSDLLHFISHDSIGGYGTGLTNVEFSRHQIMQFHAEVVVLYPTGFVCVQPPYISIKGFNRYLREHF